VTLRQVPPLLVETCHWTFEVGVPDATARNVTVLPPTTLALAGCSVTVGDVALQYLVDLIARALAAVVVRRSVIRLTVNFAGWVLADPIALKKTARNLSPRRDGELTTE
jgi:riboflavin synthase alpha subunit